MEDSLQVLKNGEIVEMDKQGPGYENMPAEIDGVNVLAGGRDMDSVKNVRKALFWDEESLLGVQA